MSPRASAVFVFLAFAAVPWVSEDSNLASKPPAAPISEQTRGQIAALIERIIAGCEAQSGPLKWPSMDAG